MKIPMKIQIYLFFLCLSCAGHCSNVPPTVERKANGHPRFILCNDGGTLGAPDMEAPIGIDGLVRETIDPLRDTMINTLYWQLGTDPYFGTATARLSDWYSHNTKVGPVWGRGREQFKTAGEWRIFKNAEALMERGTDPPTEIIKAGHQAGLDVFLSLRINDGHDSTGLDRPNGLPDGINDVNMSPQRHAHPEWLLGNEPEFQERANEGSRRQTRFAYNFAIPEVRQYVLALVTEAIRNYDLDGFDLDFCRQPSLFKKGEAANGGPLITQLLREIRAELDAKGKTAGRKLSLSVRVPPDIEANRKVGIDVRDWIKEGLVQIVVVGDPAGWNYRLPIESYLELTKGTDCKIIAQNLCAFREARGRSATVLFGEGSYYTTEQFRAVAAKHWQAGADGQYIWNQHFLKFSADDKFDRQHWKEIGDPATLEYKNKHYIVGPTGRGGTLPNILEGPGAKSETNVEIADKLEASIEKGIAVHAVLRLKVEQLTIADQITIKLNGVVLNRNSATVRLNYNDCWLDFEATRLLKNGSNILSIEVKERNPHVQAPLVLRSVEALVSY